MAFQYGGSNVLNPQWNGTPIQRVQRNGVTIWERRLVTTLPSGVIRGFNAFTWLRDHTIWDGESAVDAEIIIPGGTSLAANNPGQSGIFVPKNSFPAGSKITLTWQGTVSVRGGGGLGGSTTNTGAAPGTSGGDAIRVTGSSANVEVNLNFSGYSGTVAAGGGGGGNVYFRIPGGQFQTPYVCRFGGGGGAGDPPGPGGTAFTDGEGFGAPAYADGFDGSITAGGGGGYTGVNLGTGGVAGSRGNPGSQGIVSRTDATNISLSPAGAAGRAIEGVNLVNLQNSSNVNFIGALV